MDLPDTETNSMIQNLAENYAKYFDVQTVSQKQQLDYDFEAILTQLEEYKSSLDKVKTRNQTLLEEEIPKIFTHYQALEQTFHRIDVIENLIDEVKVDLNNLEGTVANAERDLKIAPSISAVFKPFLFMKEPSVLNQNIDENVQFTPPVLQFKANKYFPPKNDT